MQLGQYLHLNHKGFAFMTKIFICIGVKQKIINMGVITSLGGKTVFLSFIFILVL